MPEIRRATVDDVEAVVRLRLAFCGEMEGIDDEAALRALAGVIRRYLEAKLASGEFIAWLAAEDGVNVSIGGLVFYERPPTARNPAGLDAYVGNMYTVPGWRRKGLATALLREIIAYVKGTQLRRLRLHASEAGRPVYAKVGFEPNPALLDLVW